jgi:hypothetical protein
MRRPTAISALLRAFKAGSAGTIVLTALLACGEYGTSVMATPDSIVQVNVPAVLYTMSDSAKYGLGLQSGASMMVPVGISGDVHSAPRAAASSIAACGGTGFAGYTESRVPFNPEASPRFAIADTATSDDGVIQDMPLGFDFTFYGNTYNKVNFFMNGFLLFGTAPPMKQSGTAVGGFLPGQGVPPKNIIGLGWSDWTPQKVHNAILFESRGTAPNRKFIVQFNNVPEFNGSGHLMGQIVLSEGTNDITLYTNSVNVSNAKNFLTQGIQDLTGSQAMWDSVLNANTGVWSRRVHNSFALNNDAIRFSLVSTRDDVKPTFDPAPAAITQNNDPGLGSAMVSVGTAAASDNCSPVTLTSVRSDAKALDAAYPVGVTTITWTATDASGNFATATQTVTVVDVEAPVFAARAASVMEVNATSPNGALVKYDVHVGDNVGVTSLVCEPPSGSVLSAGPHPVTCTASDAAGNSSSESFSVNVIDAHQQLFNLINYVTSLGLPDGTAQPLLNQLNAAYNQDSHDQSCKKIGDFMSMVGKKDANIQSADATFMLGEASRIMSAMGCPPPKRATIFLTPSFQRFQRIM